MDYEKKIFDLLSRYDSWWDKGFPIPKMENNKIILNCTFFNIVFPSFL